MFNVMRNDGAYNLGYNSGCGPSTVNCGQFKVEDMCCIAQNGGVTAPFVDENFF
jgi:hypothetical protein